MPIALLIQLKIPSFSAKWDSHSAPIARILKNHERTDIIVLTAATAATAITTNFPKKIRPTIKKMSPNDFITEINDLTTPITLSISPLSNLNKSTKNPPFPSEFCFAPIATIAVISAVNPTITKVIASARPSVRVFISALTAAVRDQVAPVAITLVLAKNILLIAAKVVEAATLIKLAIDFNVSIFKAFLIAKYIPSVDAAIFV